MSTATLGFEIRSEQAVSAKTNLDRMTAASEQAELAQKRLATASAGSNAALARIASGVEQANALLAKLVAITDASSVASQKLSAAKLGVSKATVDGARSSEVATVALRQEAVATDQVTAAINRQNAAARAQAQATRARAAAGLDVWGRSKEDVQAHVAANSNRQVSTPAPTPAAPAQVAAATQAMSRGASAASMFGATLASIINPAMAVHFALFSLGGAAVEYFKRSRDGADKLSDALKQNRQAVTDLADAYKLVGFNIDEVTRKSVLMAEAAERQSRRQTQKALDTSLEALLSDTSNSSLGLLFPEWMRSSDVTLVFEPFRGAIEELRKGIANGRPDFVAFQESVERTANTDPGRLRLWADVLLDMQRSAADAANQLERLEDFNRNGRTGRVVGPAGMDDKQAAGRHILDQQRREREIKFAIEQEQFEARLQQQRARTNAERIAAAERVARAESDGAAVALRVERARREELQRQEMERRDATVERHRSQLRSIEAAKEELWLISASAGEAVGLRYQFSEIARLKDEAAKRGELVSAEEVERIKQTAAELAKVADAAARLNLVRDLQFERDQMFRSYEDQEIAGRLRSAGLPVDFNSYEAGLIKANQQLERMRDSWEDIFDTARDGIDGVVDALFEGGSISDALKNAGRQLARTLFDQAITNPLKNWLTGSSLNSIADLGIFGNGASSGRGGGFGGVLGNLLGAQKAVASMQVQAATVMINGSILGGGIPGLDNVTKLFSPANSNIAGPNTAATASKLLGGLGSPLGMGVDSTTTGSIAGLTSGGGVAGQVWNFFASKGLKPHMIAGIMGNVSAESAFNPLAVGDGGNAFGLFQHNDRSAGLFNFLGGKGNLGDVQGQLNFAWKELQTTEAKAMQALLASKDVRGATSAFAGFERPSGFSWGNPEGAHNFTGRLAGAEEALAKFGDSAGAATNAVATLGTSGIQVSQSLIDAAGGLTNFGGMLSSFMASPMGGGSSWFQGLMGMFGGAGGALGHMNSISPKATAHILGGFGGLFANGAAFSGGNVIPFAKGDVFSSPIHFPMSGGRTGLMGEAGPEAIMPLRRGADGKLGVASGGSSQQGGMSARQIESIVGAIAKKLSFNVKNVNVLDPSVVGDYLRTDEGEKIIMNIQRRNG